MGHSEGAHLPSLGRSRLSEAVNLTLHGAIVGAPAPNTLPQARGHPCGGVWLRAVRPTAFCCARDGAAAPQLARLETSLQPAKGEADSLRALVLRIWEEGESAGAALDPEVAGTGELLRRAGWGAERRTVRRGGGA